MKRMTFSNNRTTAESITLAKGFEKFLNHKTALSITEETLKYYTYRFERFSVYVAETTSIKFVHEITDEITEGYITYYRQQNPNIANTTINNHLRAIRCVLYYLMEKGYPIAKSKHGNRHELLRSQNLKLAQLCSMGLKFGLYGGKNNKHTSYRAAIL